MAHAICSDATPHEIVETRSFLVIDAPPFFAAVATRRLRSHADESEARDFRNQRLAVEVAPRSTHRAPAAAWASAWAWAADCDRATPRPTARRVIDDLAG